MWTLVLCTLCPLFARGAIVSQQLLSTLTTELNSTSRVTRAEFKLEISDWDPNVEVYSDFLTYQDVVTGAIQTVPFQVRYPYWEYDVEVTSYVPTNVFAIKTKSVRYDDFSTDFVRRGIEEEVRDFAVTMTSSYLRALVAAAANTSSPGPGRRLLADEGNTVTLTPQQIDNYLANYVTTNEQNVTALYVLLTSICGSLPAAVDQQACILSFTEKLNDCLGYAKLCVGNTLIQAQQYAMGSGTSTMTATFLAMRASLNTALDGLQKELEFHQGLVLTMSTVLDALQVLNAGIDNSTTINQQLMATILDAQDQITKLNTELARLLNESNVAAADRLFDLQTLQVNINIRFQLISNTQNAILQTATQAVQKMNLITQNYAAAVGQRVALGGQTWRTLQAAHQDSMIGKQAYTILNKAISATMRDMVLSGAIPFVYYPGRAPVSLSDAERRLAVGRLAIFYVSPNATLVYRTLFQFDCDMGQLALSPLLRTPGIQDVPQLFAAPTCTSDNQEACTCVMRVTRQVATVNRTAWIIQELHNASLLAQNISAPSGVLSATSAATTVARLSQTQVTNSSDWSILSQYSLVDSGAIVDEISFHCLSFANFSRSIYLYDTRDYFSKIAGVPNNPVACDASSYNFQQWMSALASGGLSIPYMTYHAISMSIQQKQPVIRDTGTLLTGNLPYPIHLSSRLAQYDAVQDEAPLQNVDGDTPKANRTRQAVKRQVTFEDVAQFVGVSVDATPVMRKFNKQAFVSVTTPSALQQDVSVQLDYLSSLLLQDVIRTAGYPTCQQHLCPTVVPALDATSHLILASQAGANATYSNATKSLINSLWEKYVYDLDWEHLLPITDAAVGKMGTPVYIEEKVDNEWYPTTASSTGLLYSDDTYGTLFRRPVVSRETWDKTTVGEFNPLAADVGLQYFRTNVSAADPSRPWDVVCNAPLVSRGMCDLLNSFYLKYNMTARKWRLYPRGGTWSITLGVTLPGSVVRPATRTFLPGCPRLVQVDDSVLDELTVWIWHDAFSNSSSNLFLNLTATKCGASNVLERREIGPITPFRWKTYKLPICLNQVMSLVVSKDSTTCFRWRSRSTRPAPSDVQTYLVETVQRERDVIGDTLRTMTARISEMRNSALDTSDELLALVNDTLLSQDQVADQVAALIAEYESNQTQAFIDAAANLYRPDVQSSDELSDLIARLVASSQNTSDLIDVILNNSKSYNNASAILQDWLAQEKELLGPWQDIFASLEEDVNKLRKYNFFVRNTPPGFAWNKLGPLINLLGEDCPARPSPFTDRGPCTCRMLREDTLKESSWDYFTPWMHPLCIAPDHPTWLGLVPFCASVPLGALFGWIVWDLVFKMRQQLLLPEHQPLCWRCFKTCECCRRCKCGRCCQPADAVKKVDSVMNGRTSS